MPLERDPLVHRIIGFAISVHSALGPGLLESAYRHCLLHQLTVNGLERLQPIHAAQVLTYMKLAGIGHGMLINFNVMLLKYGVRTFVNRELKEPGAQ